VFHYNDTVPRTRRASKKIYIQKLREKYVELQQGPRATPWETKKVKNIGRLQSRVASKRKKPDIAPSGSKDAMGRQKKLYSGKKHEEKRLGGDVKGDATRF